MQRVTVKHYNGKVRHVYVREHKVNWKLVGLVLAVLAFVAVAGLVGNADTDNLCKMYTCGR